MLAGRITCLWTVWLAASLVTCGPRVRRDRWWCHWWAVDCAGWQGPGIQRLKMPSWSVWWLHRALGCSTFLLGGEFTVMGVTGPMAWDVQFRRGWCRRLCGSEGYVVVMVIVQVPAMLTWRSVCRVMGCFRASYRNGGNQLNASLSHWDDGRWRTARVSRVDMIGRCTGGMQPLLDVALQLMLWGGCSMIVWCLEGSLVTGNASYKY